MTEPHEPLAGEIIGVTVGGAYGEDGIYLTMDARVTLADGQASIVSVTQGMGISSTPRTGDKIVVAPDKRPGTYKCVSVERQPVPDPRTNVVVPPSPALVGYKPLDPRTTVLTPIGLFATLLVLAVLDALVPKELDLPEVPVGLLGVMVLAGAAGTYYWVRHSWKTIPTAFDPMRDAELFHQGPQGVGVVTAAKTRSLTTHYRINFSTTFTLRVTVGATPPFDCELNAYVPDRSAPEVGDLIAVAVDTRVTPPYVALNTDWTAKGNPGGRALLFHRPSGSPRSFSSGTG